MRYLFLAPRLTLRHLLFGAVGMLLLACAGVGSSGVTPTAPPSPDTASPRPTPTDAAQATDVIPLETTPSPPPTETAPPAPTATSPPTATPTPAGGVVEGRVEYQQYPDNTIRPDTEATVEMVGDTSSAYFITGVNDQGRFRLSEVPAGFYWLLARSAIGSSNPQDVEVKTGETTTATLSTAFAYIPYVARPLRAAGGYVHVDGQPVAGATVWRFGGQVETNTRAITDEAGYFSFPYQENTPIVALYDDRWTVTQLQPNAVIDIELDRTGPHPPPPTGPVVTPVPVDEGVEIMVPTPPVIIPPDWTPDLEIIIPPDLIIDVRPTSIRLPPGGIQELATLAPPARVTLERPILQPTLARPILQPTLAPGVIATSAPTPTPSIPTACGQSKNRIDYGPIQVGSTVMLGRHQPVKNETNWDKTMEKFVGSKATVIRLAGLDSVGCPLVLVDVDRGQFRWRIRAMSLLEP